ncbi:MAG TPA: RNA polymerase sigma factor [Polyangiaceae bacterium]
MRRWVVSYFDFVWRVLRRLGLPEASAEDAAQDVFIIVDRKVRDRLPENIKSYLFAIALRVAADRRRSEKRRGTLLNVDDCAEVVDAQPGPDIKLDERRARDIADSILDSIPFEHRAVFMLFELEGMTLQEIAEFLGVPKGTVASRLRRGRELFFQGVQRFRARNVRANEP